MTPWGIFVFFGFSATGPVSRASRFFLPTLILRLSENRVFPLHEPPHYGAGHPPPSCGTEATGSLQLPAYENITDYLKPDIEMYSRAEEEVSAFD